MNTRQRTAALFAKYLIGECSPAEWEELLVLISGMEEDDEALLSQPMRELWERAGRRELPSSAHLIDREKMYAAVIASAPEQLIPEVPVRSFKWRKLAVAAVIAGLIISAGIYYLSRSNHAEVRKAVVAGDIKPGRGSAVLTLSNGQQLQLDSASDTIVLQNGSRVVNANGKVVYLAGANSGEGITYNTITTARANEYHLVLPDGSDVWLNAVSSIRFPTVFRGDTRTVSVTGEVFFDIAANADMPFHVKTGDVDIEVLGTQFNVNAYSDQARLKTSLLEGALKLTQGNHSGVLKPGQEAVVSGSGLTIAAGNVAMAAAWKNGFFQFDKAPLPVVLQQIGRWYDLDIRYEGPVPERLFKGKLQRSLPLSSILHLLQNGNVHFRLEGNVLTVTK